VQQQQYLVIDASCKKGSPSVRPWRLQTRARISETQSRRQSWKEAAAWLEWRGIEDIECTTPDQAGVARGKMMPSKKFTSNTSLALPSAPFMMTISGDYPEDGNGFEYPEDDGDLKLMPDLSTLSPVPWESDPTAQVICDLVHQDGRMVEFTPRNVLRRVVEQYHKLGLKPVVAPEIEFYLVSKNVDPDYPLTPPVGRSGRPIAGGSGYSIAGVNEYDELIDDIYHFSEAQGSRDRYADPRRGRGPARNQPASWRPDRTCRPGIHVQAHAARGGAETRHLRHLHGQADPGQPGSAMHIHQSIIDRKTGKNHFTAEDGSETEAFFHFIGGMQKHVPSALVMFAPYVNSYRRLTQAASAPVNTKWGYDNRTTAFRVPRSDPAGTARRKPHSVIGRQSLSGAGGVARLRPARHEEPHCARRAGGHHRQRGRDRPAARPAGGGRAVRERRRPARCVGRHFRLHLCGDQEGRVRDLHGSDQPVGEAVPTVAQCVT
jgi:glutamine synthetase